MILKAILLIVLTTVNIGPATNGRTIGVHPKTTVVLRLAENPSTGYSWKIVSKPSASLRLVSQHYEKSKLKLIGSPGFYVAELVAAKKGKAVLRLAYLRHTHPATPPAQTYKVTVVVR